MSRTSFSGSQAMNVLGALLPAFALGPLWIGWKCRPEMSRTRVSFEPTKCSRRRLRINKSAAASSLDKEVAEAAAGKNKCEVAALVGKLAAQRAVEKGISTVAFDRNGYLYHGRVKVLADAAREGGLKF